MILYKHGHYNSAVYGGYTIVLFGTRTCESTRRYQMTLRNEWFEAPVIQANQIVYFNH